MHSRAGERAAPTSRLFTPARIGSMQLANRLVMSSITTTYATDELLPSERLIEISTCCVDN